MSDTALATRPKNGAAPADIVLHSQSSGLTKEQIELLKATICKGSTDDELALFIAVANRTGLDPFSRQIHAVMRFDPRKKREAMTIQVGIDGLRLIADRTGCYAPGPEAEFAYDNQNRVFKATAFIKKWAQGEWHVVSESAHFPEYCQMTREGVPMALWASKPHVMLGKCAEARALRRAFPQETSGVYIQEEMMQQDPVDVTPVPRTPNRSAATPDEDQRPSLVNAILAVTNDLTTDQLEKFNGWVETKGGLEKLTAKALESTLQNLVKMTESNRAAEAENAAAEAGVLEGEFTAEVQHAAEANEGIDADMKAKTEEEDDPFADN